MANVFSLSSLLVMPFWLLMIAVPRARFTERLLRSPLVAVGAALLYAILVLPRIATVLPLVARPELATIAPLLGTPEGATIGWVHFLAFDLFVGRWVYLDGRARNVPVLAGSATLFFVLMLGPIGYLLHLGARAVWGPREAGPDGM
jgi:hypothetical protein